MRKRVMGFTFAALIAAVCFGASAAASSAKTVWLCFPGHHPDPCTPGLSTTVFTPTFKKTGVEHPRAEANPAIDCFYVYPTVSDQPTGNANLQIQPVERSVALSQVARYSQYCRVYAPMYRQETLAGIGEGKPTTTPNPALGFDDVQNAFETYLHKYNHGRGFVLIGHSQGSFELEQLIAKDVDPKTAVRRQLVSAILLGGNVLVKAGKDVGGTFKHIPACRSATQLGCVIAWSTFDQPVPTPSLFGRPGAIPGQPAPAGDVVLCTNPASLAGGSALVDPIFPVAPFDPTSPLAAAIAAVGVKLPPASTVFSTAPGAYRAQCSSANNANVLEITPVGGAPTPMPSPSAEWGLHLIDANIALGNLISIVSKESAAFVKSGR